MSDTELAADDLLAQARALLQRMDALGEILAAEQNRLETEQQPWLQVLQEAGLASPEAIQAHLASLSADQRRDAELAGGMPASRQEA